MRPLPKQTASSGSSATILLVAAVLLIAIIGFLVFRGQAPQSAQQSGQTDGAPSDNPRTAPGPGVSTRHTSAQENQDAKKWSAILFDASNPMKLRRQAAFELAKIGSDEALADLKQALSDNNKSLRANVAEALGSSPNPEALVMLKELTNDKDESVVLGAARGFAHRGDKDAIETLTGMLNNSQKSEVLRGGVAEILGSIKDPSVLPILIKAANSFQEPLLVESILRGIGLQPFSQTQDFYREFLARPGVPSESRVAAVEAVANVEGKTIPFLMQYTKDADPEVRAGAAWAMSTSAEPGQAGGELLSLLQSESDNAVRMRLYQALGNQEQVDMNAVLGMVQNEVNGNTRLAGLELLASACDPKANPAVTAYFNQTAVPELQNLALNGTTDYDRMVAAITLRKAKTPEANQALNQIAGQSKDPRVLRIAQGLNRTPSGTQPQPQVQK